MTEIHKEREAVLKAIVEQAEHENSLGRGSALALAEAQINLLRFRSEIAKDAAGKKEHQRKIVAIAQDLFSMTESLAKEGRRLEIDVLKAKERLLAEKQRLLEM